ncbi:MAG: hypothetical protein HY273_03920 [Gammaproteobacteria bacterium]|nr:hypothetical protein [Gammaproteobacteria bacterium]
MVRSDDDYDDEPELPPEAGHPDVLPFDPNDDWIKTADPELQKAAMRHWFCSRYENPEMGTPYDSEIGAYIFVKGGPYDPNDKIQERFSDYVSYAVMEELIDDLVGEVGDEWAPIVSEYDHYDEAFEFEVSSRDDPYRFVVQRLEEIDALLNVKVDAKVLELLWRMAFASVIAALEAYLADTVSFWLDVDKKALRDFVRSNRDFQKQTVVVSEIYECMDGLHNRVEKYLVGQVWHRLDKIKPMMSSGLGISVPPIVKLMKAVVLRHDIVHRAGKTKDGQPIRLNEAQVRELHTEVHEFIKVIESELNKRFPRNRT